MVSRELSDGPPPARAGDSRSVSLVPGGSGQCVPADKPSQSCTSGRHGSYRGLLHGCGGEQKPRGDLTVVDSRAPGASAAQEDVGIMEPLAVSDGAVVGEPVDHEIEACGQSGVPCRERETAVFDLVVEGGDDKGSAGF